MKKSTDNVPCEPTAVGPASATDARTTCERHGRRRKVRRWCYRGLLVLGGLLLLLGGTPRLVSCRWCHDWLLRRVSQNINGHFAVEGLELGWLSSPHLEEFRIYPKEGPPLVVLPDVETPAALYRFGIKGTDLGTWVFDRPQVYLHVDADGTNFAKTFVRPSPLVERIARSLVHDHRFAAKIVAGRFEFSRDAHPTWSLDELHATIGFSPPTATDPSPHVSLQPGRVLDHLEVSPPICNDLLKFAAPVLADATWVEGRVSLDLDHVDIPLRDPAAGEVDGAMRIHAVRAGPGPLVTRLAALLGLPTQTQLVDESVVRFTMQERHVRHEGLEFALGPVRVVTHGQIALADESLDMSAEIGFPEFGEETGPLRRAISGRTITVPITGTLREPKLGDGGIIPEDLGSVLKAARELFRGRKWPRRETPLWDRLRLRRPADHVPQPPAPAEALPDKSVLDSKDAAGQESEDAAPEDAEAEPPARRRLLPRLRPRRRD